MNRTTKITLSVLLLALASLGLAYYGQQANWFKGSLNLGLGEVSEQKNSNLTLGSIGDLDQSGSGTADNSFDLSENQSNSDNSTGQIGELSDNTGSSGTIEDLNDSNHDICHLQAQTTTKPLEVKFVMETGFGEDGYYDTWVLSTGETSTPPQTAPVPQEKTYTYSKAGKYTATLELFKEDHAGRTALSLGTCDTEVVVSSISVKNTPVSMSATAMYEDSTPFPGEARVNIPITLQLDTRFTDNELNQIDYTQILITKNIVPDDLNTVTTPCEMDQFEHAINIKDTCYFFANPSKDKLEDLLKEGNTDASPDNNDPTPARYVRRATFAEYGRYYVTLVTREVYPDGTYRWNDNSNSALELKLNPISQYIHAPVISDLKYSEALVLPEVQEVSVKITDSAKDFDLANSYVTFAQQATGSKTKPDYRCDVKSSIIKLPCYATLAVNTNVNTPDNYTITPVNFAGLKGDFMLSVEAYDKQGAHSTKTGNFIVSAGSVENPPPVVNVFSMVPDQFVANEIASTKFDVRASDAVGLRDVEQTEVLLLDRSFTDEQTASTYLLPSDLSSCNSTTNLPCKVTLNKIPLEQSGSGEYDPPVDKTMFQGGTTFLPTEVGAFSALAVATDHGGQKGYKLHNFTVIGQLEPPTPPVEISLSLTVPLQDRDTNPNSDRGTHSALVWFALYESTASNPIYKQQVMTDQNGTAQIDLGEFEPGSYIAVVKTSQHLAKGLDVELLEGSNDITYPNLLGGDISGDPNTVFPGVYDDIVNSVDISQLFADWGSKRGESGFNPDSDLDANTEVGAEDFSTLIANANKTGDLR